MSGTRLDKDLQKAACCCSSGLRDATLQVLLLCEVSALIVWCGAGEGIADGEQDHLFSLAGLKVSMFWRDLCTVIASSFGVFSAPHVQQHHKLLLQRESGWCD